MEEFVTSARRRRCCVYSLFCVPLDKGCWLGRSGDLVRVTSNAYLGKRGEGWWGASCANTLEIPFPISCDSVGSFLPLSRSASVELLKSFVSSPTQSHLFQVSVLVASGDDGAGQSATCPVDPRYPVDVSGGTVEGMETRCPFDDREDCKCGSFEMELRHK